MSARRSCGPYECSGANFTCRPATSNTPSRTQIPRPFNQTQKSEIAGKQIALTQAAVNKLAAARKALSEELDAKKKVLRKLGAEDKVLFELDTETQVLQKEVTCQTAALQVSFGKNKARQAELARLRASATKETATVAKLDAKHEEMKKKVATVESDYASFKSALEKKRGELQKMWSEQSGAASTRLAEYEQAVARQEAGANNEAARLHLLKDDADKVKASIAEMQCTSEYLKHK